MTDNDQEALEAFTKELAKNPKLLEQLQKKSELEDFKERYNVKRATPLKCPACSQYMVTGGSLWINKDDHLKFVCRKCKLEWILGCLTKDNDILIEELRKILKGGE